MKTLAKTYMGTTPGGKEIYLAKVKQGNKVIRVLQFKGGGEMPKSLLGMFSDTRIALVKVTEYIDKVKLDKATNSKPTQKRGQKKEAVVAEKAA